MSNGDAVTTITLATTDSWKNRNGEKQEKTEWHRIIFYRKLAEIAGEYLRKGRFVHVEGRLETKKWTDKSGVERYSTQIIGNDMKMLCNRPAESTDGSGSDDQPTPQKAGAGSGGGGGGGRGFDDDDGDIPF